jgi:F0F1-type ATP synthase assembly protein I
MYGYDEDDTYESADDEFEVAVPRQMTRYQLGANVVMGAVLVVGVVIGAVVGWLVCKKMSSKE